MLSNSKMSPALKLTEAGIDRELSQRKELSVVSYTSLICSGGNKEGEKVQRVFENFLTVR